jgi:hypothetical protein
MGRVAPPQTILILMKTQTTRSPNPSCCWCSDRAQIAHPPEDARLSFRCAADIAPTGHRHELTIEFIQYDDQSRLTSSRHNSRTPTPATSNSTVTVTATATATATATVTVTVTASTQRPPTTSTGKSMQPVSVALLLALGVASLGSALAGAVAEEPAVAGQLDSAGDRGLVVSDEDRATMQRVKSLLETNFSAPSFKELDEVHKFLGQVRLLAHRHPKNVAFARAELKELHQLLSQEPVTRLVRLDASPFEAPVSSDERLALAQRAADEDELTGKLFGGPLRSLAEEAERRRRRQQQQQHARTEDAAGGQHRDGNFFVNLWCKISGECPN